MEQKVVFIQLLDEIAKLARSKDNCLSREEVDAFFEHAALKEEQLAYIYQYLSERGIRVSGYERTETRFFRDGELPERDSAVLERDKNDPGRGTELSGSDEETSQRGGEDSEDIRTGGLEAYLDTVAGFEALDPSEELTLFHLAAMGDKAAREKLTHAYLPVVCDLAGELIKDGMYAEDLIQEGNLALWMALDGLERKESLAAYQAALLNKLSESMSGATEEWQNSLEEGQRIVNRVTRLDRAVRELEDQLEHRVSPAELSAWLDVPEEEIQDVMNLVRDAIRRTEDGDR